MQCGIYIPTDKEGLHQYPCHRESIRCCDDCGQQLCREHLYFCRGCDTYFCEVCLDLHQTNDPLIPRCEVVEAA